jgi:hypothetical protein
MTMAAGIEGKYKIQQSTKSGSGRNGGDGDGDGGRW